jgi:two-component system phosphate regulon response regulator PhoB
MTERARIVVVEDEMQVRDMVLDVLGDAGFDAVGAEDGLSGMRAIREHRPDLVLLDVHLPGGMSGREVLRRLRAEGATAHLPIVVLTGQDDDQLELTFLEEGADDYLRKTFFRPRLLVGRIKAVLRRTGGSETDSDVIRQDPLVIHPGRREVMVEGKPINLTPTEFDILFKLASNRDRALPRRELIDRGDEGEGDDRTVDVHVLSIRRKLGKQAWLVSTVWGVGYRLGSAPGS